MNRSRAITARHVVLVVVGLACGEACGVSRSAAYFELLGQFGKAESRNAMPHDQATPAWDFEVPLARRGVVARVLGRKGMDVVRVQYSDEPEPRTPYEYVDYSNPIDVRVHGSILYIHWSETLFSSKAYVLAYDLEGRRVLAKHRVDPRDVRGR